MTAGDRPSGGQEVETGAAAREVGRAIRRIKVEPMEADTFTPFGTLIHAEGRPPDFQGGGQSVGWAVPFETDGRPQVTVVVSPFQGLRFGKLERHFGVTQAFIPLGGSPAVVAVAAPTAHPDRDPVPRPEDVRAFLIDDRKGYLLKRGTWHALDRFPLHPPDSVFVVLSDVETSEDLARGYAGSGGWQLSQEVDYEAGFGVRFELVL